MENSIYHSELLYNCFKKLNLCQIFPHTTLKHIMAIFISVFSLGYRRKTIDFEKYNPCHRTTVAHFLNKGKWDDTISTKTKPLSQALRPFENAYFHQAHLKSKQDYGHQAVAVMLSCNDIGEF